MFKKRHLLFSFLLLAALSSCSTHKDATPTLTNSERVVASSDQGIAFPAYATFDLRSNLGKTYTTFLKKSLKPTLDKLSDTANGGGGGFDNVGASGFLRNASFLDKKTLAGYKGAKWNRAKRVYEGALPDEQVASVYNALLTIKPRSTVDSLTYFNREDKAWPQKNDMALALRAAKINAAPFDLATLYALTSGLGVKVKIDDNNYNYHVLYKTGKTNPSEEVMSGRSFASSPTHAASDATDPEYLKDLRAYLDQTSDVKPFYRAIILALASSDPSGWATVSDLGQTVLSDFFTVYTAEADRHLMVNLKDGKHPWEIDLAAVTAVSVVSARTGKVVTGGVVTESDLGGWFAPSPNNKEGGPQRSGIGITRRDRLVLQKAIHNFEMKTQDGRLLIAEIQSIIGNKVNGNDVIQAVFEYLSNPETPETMGLNATRLADLFARYLEIAGEDAEEIMATI